MPPPPSAFALKLGGVAQDQHTQFHGLDEADDPMCNQIKKYSSDLHLGSTDCVKEPWSAIFVSWCVMTAGATAAEFKFSKAHSVFVHEAIKNADNGTGVFQGFAISAQAPGVGDIIQNNRAGNTFDFPFARKNTNYLSHSAIVVKVDQDADGMFALTIGGNEGNSIRQTIVRLTPQGFVQQRTKNPFICILKTLK
jgi:hypothetical protein